MPKSKFSLFTFLLLLLVTESARAQDYELIPGVVGVHTNIGTGVHSPETIAGLARERNIPIVIITELALIKCEYGLFPLRGIVKRAFRKNSVLNYGAKKYLKEIVRVNESYSGVLLIPGTEVAPFYYWTGSYFKKDLTMHNWHKQFLVIGLNKARDYKNLPMVSNPHYSRGSICRFWPLIPVLFSIWLIRMKKKRRIWGIVIVTLGGLFLVNNFPFKTDQYDQYHGDQGEAPYQRLIDYVNEKDALSFWSLPEATTDMKMTGARSYTLPFPESLSATRDYGGFSAFYEGWRTVAKPGGIWDKVLNEYCEGKRERPVWAIGEVDYRYTRPGKDMDSVQTVFLIPRLDKKAVIDALRLGRMYALRKANQEALSLDKFVVKDDSRVAIMGETLVSNNRPVIQIRVSCPDPKVEKIKVRVIRKGEIIKIFNVGNLEEITYEEDYYKPGERVYYRLDIMTDQWNRIITNPVFVKFEPQTSGV